MKFKIAISAASKIVKIRKTVEDVGNGCVTNVTTVRNRKINKLTTRIQLITRKSTRKGLHRSNFANRIWPLAERRTGHDCHTFRSPEICFIFAAAIFLNLHFSCQRTHQKCKHALSHTGHHNIKILHLFMTRVLVHYTLTCFKQNSPINSKTVREIFQTFTLCRFRKFYNFLKIITS